MGLGAKHVKGGNHEGAKMRDGTWCETREGGNREDAKMRDGFCV